MKRLHQAIFVPLCFVAFMATARADALPSLVGSRPKCPDTVSPNTVESENSAVRHRAAITGALSQSVFFHGEKTSVDLNAPDGSEFVVEGKRIKLVRSIYGDRKLVLIEVTGENMHETRELVAKQNIEEIEVQRTEGAQGPGVITGYGHFYDKNNRPILVVEKMEHPLYSVAFNHDYLMAAIDTLRRLHAKNLIHTDIKHPNFMLDASMKLKFIDFALTQYGTRDYSDYRTGTVAGDEYALGITMLEWKSQEALKRFMPKIYASLSWNLMNSFLEMVMELRYDGKLDPFNEDFDYQGKTDARINGFKCRLLEDFFLEKIKELEHKTRAQLLDEKMAQMKEKPTDEQFKRIQNMSTQKLIRGILTTRYANERAFEEFEDLFWSRMKTDLVSPSDPDGKIIWDLIERNK